MRLSTVPSYPTVTLPAVLVIGIGLVGFPAINIQATNGIEDEEQGLAVGVLETSVQVGAAVVLAVITAIISSGGQRRRGHAVRDARHLRPGLEFAAGVSLVGARVTLLAFLSRLLRQEADPPESEAKLELVG